MTPLPTASSTGSGDSPGPKDGGERVGLAGVGHRLRTPRRRNVALDVPGRRGLQPAPQRGRGSDPGSGVGVELHETHRSGGGGSSHRSCCSGCDPGLFGPHQHRAVFDCVEPAQQHERFPCPEAGPARLVEHRRVGPDVRCGQHVTRRAEDSAEEAGASRIVAQLLPGLAAGGDVIFLAPPPHCCEHAVSRSHRGRRLALPPTASAAAR